MHAKPTFLCPYCGTALSKENWSKEHVVPDCLFADPKPPNLMTVKACRTCNSRFSDDEELFMMWLLAGPPGEGDVGKMLWAQKIDRTLDAKPALMQLLLSNTKPVNVITSTGIHLGPGMAIEIEEARKAAVLEKIVRCLYVYTYKQVLPVSTEIRSSSTLAADRAKAVAQILHPGKRAYPGVFRYKYNRVDDSPIHSCWLLLFYDRIPFMVVTREAQDHTKAT
jgi:RNA polymerase subunit RPABC4/transcription elongation factor Spt4